MVDKSSRLKIAVIGIGYVGLANALLLAKKHDVIAVDIDQRKVEMLNKGHAPVLDKNMEQFIENEELSLYATTDLQKATLGADYIIIATPTDYALTTNCFDTRTVTENIHAALGNNTNADIIIKSTIPVGFVDEVRRREETDRIVFSPEFLREEHALHDCLNPFRIIVGDKGERGKRIAKLFLSQTQNPHIPVLLTGTHEAESIKLFSNTYLAMRIAFFNELDSFALARHMNVRDIIEGVSSDQRIGNHYNNPSFGYGGYCLPKDTKQLLANYQQVPQNLIRAIVEANSTRKLFLARQILQTNPKCVGVYRLISEPGSGNFRESAIQDIMLFLKGHGLPVIIYEPLIEASSFQGVPVVRDLHEFKKEASLILANRMAVEIEDVDQKVYTRDLIHRQHFLK